MMENNNGNIQKYPKEGYLDDAVSPVFELPHLNFLADHPSDALDNKGCVVIRSLKWEHSGGIMDPSGCEKSTLRYRVGLLDNPGDGNQIIHQKFHH